MTRARLVAKVGLSIALTFTLLELGSAWLMTRPGWEPLSASDFDTGTPEVENTTGQEAENRLFQVSILHPFLGHVRDPNRVDPGFNPRWSEFGFAQRGPIFFQPDDDRLVVAVLGGSVARGLAVKEGLLEGALGALPRFRGREVCLVVLAAGGYRQPQQLMTLHYFLALGAHFDLVLNVDGFNDFVLAAKAYRPDGLFPFFPVGWDERLGALDLNGRRRVGELAFLARRRQETAESLARGPWRHSRFARLVGVWLDHRWRTRAAEVREAMQVEATTQAERDFQALGPRLSFAEPAHLHQALVTVWSRASRMLDATARAHGIEYHHFLQPNQYLDGAKPLSDEELRIAWKSDHPHRELVNLGYPRLRAAGAALRDEGVRFHDLSLIFEGRPETLYRDRCCHLNRAGNERLAAAVAASVGEALPEP